jgi:hypothetical protein
LRIIIDLPTYPIFQFCKQTKLYGEQNITFLVAISVSLFVWACNRHDFDVFHSYWARYCHGSQNNFLVVARVTEQLPGCCQGYGSMPIS